MKSEILLTLAVGVVAAVFFCCVLSYYDNVHRATSNGLWKSIDVERWVSHSPDRQTDGGNLIYYPVVGAMVRALPESLGPTWRRMAFVNAGFGAAAIAFTYVLGLLLFESRPAAVFMCATQAFCGFFLVLATINEDIMPGYACFVGAVTCAVATARRPGALGITMTAQCLVLSWLFHSSLQLPGIGAFVLAILASDASLSARLRRAMLFLVCLIPLAVGLAVINGVPWSVGLWSGKGLGTGWGGFRINKIIFMWSGIAQYVATGQNIALIDAVLARRNVEWTAVVWVVIIALAAVWVRECRRRFADAGWRSAAVILGAAFVLGEGMNLYIQPQDPQMQLQPMMWMPVAAGCVHWLVDRAVWPRFARIGVRCALAAGLALLFVANAQAYMPTRHVDSVALTDVRDIELVAPPENTVFVVHGFEAMNTWLSANWGRGAVWPNADLALDHGHNYKTIYTASEATVFPRRPPDESAANLVKLIGRAIDEGYAVVASDFWVNTEQEWISSFSTTSGSEKPRAIYRALHSEFAGAEIGRIRSWGSLYRLSRKARDAR